MPEPFRTILIDPPWQLSLTGKRSWKHHPQGMPKALPYPTMSLDQLKALPVADLATDDCHLWLWTTNQTLPAGFDLLNHWGFKYLAPIHAVKPSGVGNYFIARTQTLLFAYRKRCNFPLARYQPNIITVGQPVRHSQKWECTYQYIEAISPAPRLEMFARQARTGWTAFGNEIDGQDILQAMGIDKT